MNPFSMLATYSAVHNLDVNATGCVGCNQFRYIYVVFDLLLHLLDLVHTEAERERHSAGSSIVKAFCTCS